MKALLGLALAFAIGFACRAFGIPSPALPLIVGAVLVVSPVGAFLLVAWYDLRQQYSKTNGEQYVRVVARG